MSRAKRIMVQGTMSGAGKSLLCAALCRIFAQDGYRVAPFKSQNMALNSFVTRDGLEMGRAQVVQAQAAGVEPNVRMNPILLKPSSDTGSQVIVGGEVRGQMSAAAYFKMKRQLIPEILAAFDSLSEEADIVVIEGAGSPAEINLKADDIVNMGLAKLVDAPVLLAGDIDRGGVFAQLYGTVALLEPEERARIAGLVINKFRGDVDILRPGLAMLEEKTGLPVLGVVPYLHVEIEDEDSLSERLNARDAVKPLDVAVIRLPHISNFTDFIPLEQHELLGVRYVQRARELGAPDLVILPGTKNTMEDLLWLRQSGLEAAVRKLAQAQTPVLGVCGGYQMLGQTLDDPAGTESGKPLSLAGLGLLMGWAAGMLMFGLFRLCRWRGRIPVLQKAQQFIGNLLGRFLRDFHGVAGEKDTVDGKAAFLPLGDGRGEFGEQVGVGVDTALEVLFHRRLVGKAFPVLTGDLTARAGIVRLPGGVECQIPRNFPGDRHRFLFGFVIAGVLIDAPRHFVDHVADLMPVVLTIYPDVSRVRGGRYCQILLCLPQFTGFHRLLYPLLADFQYFCINGFFLVNTGLLLFFQRVGRKFDQLGEVGLAARKIDVT